MFTFFQFHSSAILRFLFWSLKPNHLLSLMPHKCVLSAQQVTCVPPLANTTFFNGTWR